jgi:hypothetical protein
MTQTGAINAQHTQIARDASHQKLSPVLQIEMKYVHVFNTVLIVVQTEMCECRNNAQYGDSEKPL